MDLSKEIKILLIKRDIKSEAELARRIGLRPQNLNQKIRTIDSKIKDLEDIAAAAGCDVEIRFLDKETGEPG